jgi:hypothetical protein
MTSKSHSTVAFQLKEEIRYGHMHCTVGQISLTSSIRDRISAFRKPVKKDYCTVLIVDCL